MLGMMPRLSGGRTSVADWAFMPATKTWSRGWHRNTMPTGECLVLLILVPHLSHSFNGLPVEVSTCLCTHSLSYSGPLILFHPLALQYPYHYFVHLILSFSCPIIVPFFLLLWHFYIFHIHSTLTYLTHLIFFLRYYYILLYTSSLQNQVLSLFHPPLSVFLHSLQWFRTSEYNNIRSQQEASQYSNSPALSP